MDVCYYHARTAERNGIKGTELDYSLEENKDFLLSSHYETGRVVAAE